MENKSPRNRIAGNTLFSVFLSVVFILSFNDFIMAQQDSGGIVLKAEVVGTDTIPVVVMNDFNVVEKYDPDALKKLNEMNRLYANVKKVLPYARVAKAKLDEINEHVATMSDKSQRKDYIKSEEKIMKERFEAELKNLSITQGRILIKLVYRETGETSYDLVKELRGSLVASFWQGMAKIFGSSLKTKYDAEGEDKAVEIIVREIDSAGFVPIKLK